MENIFTETMKMGAIKFAQWLQDNRWYTFDKQTQKWCYTFEGGTSIGRKAYEKNYMKTSDELWEKFILSECERLKT